MNHGKCPECDNEVTLESAGSLDHRVSCAHCGAQLVVISVDPLELDWAFVEPLPKPSLNVGRSVDLRDRV